jgi:hypothetical protein
MPYGNFVDRKHTLAKVQTEYFEGLDDGGQSDLLVPPKKELDVRSDPFALNRRRGNPVDSKDIHD